MDSWKGGGQHEEDQEETSVLGSFVDPTLVGEYALLANGQTGGVVVIDRSGHPVNVNRHFEGDTNEHSESSRGRPAQ